MKHNFSRRVISMLLTLLMVVSLFSAFATTATAEAKIIDLPLIINGGAMVGDDLPNGIYNLPQIEGVEYCDEDCDCGNPEHYWSNRWYNQSDTSVATEFVDGEYYVYIITIHPKAGYAFPSDITESSDLIYVTNVAWGQKVNAIVDPDCICVAFRYRYYDADNGVVGGENISAPISIDGTALREITQPTSLGLENLTSEYTHCDGVACSCSDAYLSDTWFDAFGNVVTEFEEGEEYFYQVTIHFEGEYTLNPNILPKHAINVTGIAWDYVVANFDGRRLYAEFHIENYDPTEGIPVRYSADWPCVFDGKKLGGLNTPMGLGLEDTEEYYHCYDGCNNSYWWTSDTWFTSDDEVATEFIDGERYYYQITLHAQPGYYFDFEYISQDQIPIMVTGIKWDSISWTEHFDGVSASFYMTYDAETGVPFAEIVDPIVIDGSSMAGETTPTFIDIPEADEGYYFCADIDCDFGRDWPSFIWYDYDDAPVTEFIDGETYYFQVAVHTEVGYEFDVTEDGDVTDYDLIRVTGIDWDYTRSWYDYTTRLLYTEFYIIYDASVGIPALKTVDTVESLAISGLTIPTIGQTVDEYFAKINALTVTPNYRIADGALFKAGEERPLPGNYVLKEGETYQLALAFDVQLAAGGTVTVDKGKVVSATNIDGEWLDIRIEFTLSSEPDYTVGDINGNGKIDARDYLLLKRAYFGTYTLTCAPEAADVNGNGKLDARDYLLLKRAYFGTYEIK